MTTCKITIFCVIVLAYASFAKATYLYHTTFMSWHGGKICNGSYKTQAICDKVSPGTTAVCGEYSIYLLDADGTGSSSKLNILTCQAGDWIKSCVCATNTTNKYGVFNYDDDGDCSSYFTQTIKV